MSNSISKMEQLKKLKSGKGFQYLLNEASKILQNPIIMHDMDFKLIAYTENVITDDPIWNEFMQTGRASRDLLEFYKNESFLNAVANADRITFLYSDKLKYERILGKLFNCDNIQVGVTSIEAHKPFIEDIQALFSFYCDIVNKEIAKIDYYKNYGQEYQEVLINKLIKGDIEDKAIYTAHVASIYMNLKSQLFIAVIDVTQCDPSYTKLMYFRDLLKHAQPCYKYSIYMNYIIIIISSDNMMLNKNKDLGRLSRFLLQNNMYAGISSCFENLYELQKYYMEAVTALSNRKSIQPICFFSELDMIE